MKNLTIKTNCIENTISIIYGQEIDYNTNVKNFNNNGIWGEIVNSGVVLATFKYNPNKVEANFGQSDYDSMLSYAKKQLARYKSLNANQIQNIIQSL